MGKVNVVIVDATGNKEQRVGLPDDIKCGIIMVKLVEKIKLPSVGPDGNPIAVHVMDGAFLVSYEVAVKKAYTAVAVKMSTMELKPLAQPGASLYGIQFTNGGRIVIFGGGDPLYGEGGRIIGGLGVSGGSEEQDAALSAFGRAYFENLN